MKSKWYLKMLFGPKSLGTQWDLYLFRQAWRRLFDGRYRYSDSRLLQFQDRYKGEECVIIGNGPSLRHTNMSLLKGRHTFGTNRIYLGKDDFGFLPEFYLCVNQLVLEQCWEDIIQLPMPKFVSSHRGVMKTDDKDVIYLRTMGQPDNELSFSCNLLAGLWEGYTVTYVAMQLAYWMGFQKVMLVGVDHNFVTQGEPNKEVVSQADDPNHFSGKYFAKGFRWQLPDLVNSELAYRMADFTFRTTRREIVDCTVDGKCQVFRKSTLEAELKKL
jgi:hypothetical protein